MTSGETLPLGGPPPAAAVTGIVVVAHGGQVSGTQPTTAYQPAVLRMIPVAAAIRQALDGSGAAVLRPRFRVRGWNGALASPVPDLEETLDDIVVRYGLVPVVLVGHSMGARAAARAAGHPVVAAVVGLAPWLPPGEPVDQLSGRSVLLAHGTADVVTNPAETWAYADRARALSRVTEVEIRGGDHPMIRRAAQWHALTATFVGASLGFPPPPGPSASALARPRRAVL